MGHALHLSGSDLSEIQFEIDMNRTASSCL